MSETDSFIAEVTEDVRRDKLFAMFRKYGWIAAVVILALVGGTAYSEWSKSQAAEAAQARGDAVLDALALEDEAVLNETLSNLAAAEDASVAERLLAARPETDNAQALLEGLANDSDQPAYISDLARLKLALLPDALSGEDRVAVLQDLAQPGQLYRNPATEILVGVYLQQDNREAALQLMQDHIQDAETPSAQAQRFLELIVAMGETPELANQQSADTQN